MKAGVIHPPPTRRQRSLHSCSHVSLWSSYARATVRMYSKEPRLRRILIVSNTLFIQAKRCLPLSRCQEVQWIAEKQAELDISSKILNQISCGFEGGQPKVWCNVEGGIEDSSLYGTFQMLVQRPSQCIGQLKVYTAMENSLQIYNFRTVRAKETHNKSN